LKVWQWVLIGLGGFVALVIVIAMATAGGGGSTTQPSQSSSSSGGTSAPATQPANPPATNPAPATAQHHQVGEVVNTPAGWQVTVNSVKTSQGDELFTPKAGNTYLVVDVTLKNTTTEQQPVSSLLQFSIKDATGQEYNQALAPSDVTSTPDGKVEAGGILRGQLAYEVPTSQHQFTFAFQPSFGSDQVIWDVRV